MLKLCINLYKINTKMNKVKKYKSITRQISFPQKLMDRVESKAESLGYSLPAYVRYVLTKELEKREVVEFDNFVLDDEMIKSIKQSIKDSSEGKLKVLKSEKDIEKFCKGVLEDEN